jgi:hypothetical protein
VIASSAGLICQFISLKLDLSGLQQSPQLFELCLALGIISPDKATFGAGELRTFRAVNVSSLSATGTNLAHIAKADLLPF